MAGSGSRNERRPIVIRREEVIEGGHHGGAWKVAYADFVTAMMAFFLLMWLLNATTEAQRKGLADYFTPTNATSHNSSGSGKPFGGNTPFEDGHEVSDRGTQAVMVGKSQAEPQDPSPEAPDGVAQSHQPAEEEGQDGRTGRAPEAGEQASGGGQAVAASAAPVRADYLAQAASGSAPKIDAKATDPKLLSDAALQAELARRERTSFEQAAQAIRDAVRADPALADLARQLTIDMTPEGLRIQILDADRAPMFATGSATLADRARALITRIAPVLARMPEPIAISGHTDAAAYKGGDKTNWELSSDRANATRRLLVESGLGESRFSSVSGNADREPLLADDPLAAANRRIAITVLRALPGPAAAPAPPAQPGPASPPRSPAGQ